VRGQVRKAMESLKRKLSMAVFVTTDDFVTEKFITIKDLAAKDIGITMEIIRPTAFEGTEELLRSVLHAARDHDGVVIQMPIHHSIDVNTIRKLIPITHDVDVFGDTAFTQFQEKRLPILPPVVAAIAEILHRHKIRLAGKKMVVVGQGKLVGLPASIWAEHMGAFVQTITKETRDIAKYTKDAEVLILGAGVSGLIIVFLEIEKKQYHQTHRHLSGDADPACADKASLFTPVPGGIGPISVAMLYKNLVSLTFRREGITDFEALHSLSDDEDLR